MMCGGKRRGERHMMWWVLKGGVGERGIHVGCLKRGGEPRWGDGKAGKVNSTAPSHIFTKKKQSPE